MFHRFTRKNFDPNVPVLLKKARKMTFNNKYRGQIKNIEKGLGKSINYPTAKGEIQRIIKEIELAHAQTNAIGTISKHSHHPAIQRVFFNAVKSANSSNKVRNIVSSSQNLSKNLKNMAQFLENQGSGYGAPISKYRARNESNTAWRSNTSNLLRNYKNAKNRKNIEQLGRLVNRFRNVQGRSVFGQSVNH